MSAPPTAAGRRRATVAVIGAGQAGLSATHHLLRRGYVDAVAEPNAPRTMIVFDAEEAPGGAWRHRWESLRMATVNGIFDLPGFPKPPIDPREPAREAVPAYFAAYERERALPIHRPVRIDSVRRADASPTGDLLIDGSAGAWAVRALINATGTWNNPLRPRYPGGESFRGRQLHTRDYIAAAELAGLRVAVVGGGISAIQLLDEISQVATTFWYTRREPVFIEGDFVPEMHGRAAVARVAADAEAGRPARSVVSYTGLVWTGYARAAQARGALERRPMFTAIEPLGVRESDGSFTPVDAILWATGFRAALSHLDPLELRNAQGGIAVRGTQVASEPRVHLIGFGPSQSTVGANRAGRAAAHALDGLLAEPSPTA